MTRGKSRTAKRISRDELTPADEARFCAKVDSSCGDEGCWLWTAGTNLDGYGSFWINGRYVCAHRLAYALEHGEAPADIDVLHSCDTPRCVNVHHLSLGDDAENTRQKVERNRQAQGLKHRAVSGIPKTSPHASRFRGVCWDARARKWKAQIWADGRQRHLGLFTREDDAAAAYQGMLHALAIRDAYRADFERLAECAA